MSTTAEDISATVTPEGANLSDVDQIAELLAGEDETKDDEETGEETQTQASTDSEDEESNDESNAEAEDQEQVAAADSEDEDLTWGKVLGISDDNLTFDEDGNLTGFQAKVNGEVITLTGEELLAGFQTNKAVTTKGQELAEARKAFEVEQEQAKQVYASKLESVDLLTKHFEQQLIAEYDGVEWDKLNAEDPARYAAMRLDFQQKAGELQRIQEAIQKDKATEIEAFQKDAVEKQNVYLKQQYDLMLEKNPEWQDKEVRDKAQASFRNFVSETYGFSDQEFDTVFDARLIELIKDAKRFHDGVKVAGKKRQNPVPRFQKSVGGKQRKTPSKLDKLTKAIPKAQGDQKRDLQASAVAELLMGNE